MRKIYLPKRFDSFPPAAKSSHNLSTLFFISPLIIIFSYYLYVSSTLLSVLQMIYLLSNHPYIKNAYIYVHFTLN